MHYVYLPRIEQAIRECSNQWNNHDLSTQGGQTPLQLQNDVLDVNNYGIDDEGPLLELQTNNNVVIPNINVTINETTMNIIQQVNPLENDGNHGIDVFLSLLYLMQ